MQTMLRPNTACATIPPTAYTAAGFRAWMESADFPKSGRTELFGNRVFVDMSPEHESRHAQVKGEIFFVLKGLVESLDLGEIRADGVTFTDEAQDLVTQPDAMFFTWASYRSGCVQGGEQGEDTLGFSGEVDWLLEVVSPSSVKKDQGHRERYAQAGVREYWIVDARGDEVVLEIHKLEDGSYRQEPSKDGFAHSQVFEQRFRLVRTVSSIGGWRYELAIRSAGL